MGSDMKNAVIAYLVILLTGTGISLYLTDPGAEPVAPVSPQVSDEYLLNLIGENITKADVQSAPIICVGKNVTTIETLMNTRIIAFVTPGDLKACIRIAGEKSVNSLWSGSNPTITITQPYNQTVTAVTEQDSWGNSISTYGGGASTFVAYLNGTIHFDEEYIHQWINVTVGLTVIYPQFLILFVTEMLFAREQALSL